MSGICFSKCHSMAGKPEILMKIPIVQLQVGKGGNVRRWRDERQRVFTSSESESLREKDKRRMKAETWTVLLTAHRVAIIKLFVAMFYSWGFEATLIQRRHLHLCLLCVMLLQTQQKESLIPGNWQQSLMSTPMLSRHKHFLLQNRVEAILEMSSNAPLAITQFTQIKRQPSCMYDIW